MLLRQTKKVYRIISFLILLAFIFTNAGYASVGSCALRPPMHFAELQKYKRTTSRDKNPFLCLLRKQCPRGNITIDEHTILISMGGGDGNGLNTFIARTAKKAHAQGERVVVVLHGLKGLLVENYKDNLFEITPELAEKMDGLPSIASGSSRVKIDPEKKEADYAKIDTIIEIVKPAKRVIFIGGNDHLKLTYIVAHRIQELNMVGEQYIATEIIGVSKSIDNDFKNRMFGFWTAYMSGRKIVKRASVQDGGSETRVFESFGRNMGDLNLRMSEACPYSKAVLNPEKKVRIQDIIDAYNQGVRNFFVSEGFSLSENDPQLDELLKNKPVLKAMWDKAHTTLERDAWGHPRLAGVSLYVVGILEYFCNSRPGRTDLTYQLRGAFSEKDSDGRDFEEFLAEGMSAIAVQPIALGQNGLALVYDEDYGDFDTRAFTTRPAQEVYQTINLTNLMDDVELAKLGVLGTEAPVFKADPASVPEEDIALEYAMEKIFNADAASTAAHTCASVMELRESSEAIITSCGRKNSAEIAKLPYELGAVVEGTQDSVLILIPEKQVSFYEIAKRIKEIIDEVGYVNIAVSNRFGLDPEDFLLKEIIKPNPVLSLRFLEAKEEAIRKGSPLVTFDSGVSQFILELFKYLKIVDTRQFTRSVPYSEYDNLRRLKIDFESARVADMGYAFEGLKSEGYPEGLLANDELLVERGVIVVNPGELLQQRAIGSGV